MDKKETKSRFFNITTLKIAGIIFVILLAIALLWHGNATSTQALMPFTAQVYFDGDYKIADGEWQEIVKGEHIPSTKGDVTLRGNFHLLTPDGEYIGVYSDEIPVAFYLNHIGITIFEQGKEPVIMDSEDPLYGDAACCVVWDAYSFTPGNTEPVEILIHNPHKYGNENAIDELLDNTALWTGIDFEKSVLDRGEIQRNIGLFFVITSILFLGGALFSTLIHIKNSKILWVIGGVIIFAGAYLIYSSDSISFWSESVVSNTIMLCISMMLYMLFIIMTVVHFLKSTKTVGTITVAALVAAILMFLILPLVSDILIYDTLPYWIIVQTAFNIVILSCLIKEFIATKEKVRWLYIGFTLPLISFILDSIITKLGLWEGGISSAYIFLCLFIAAIIVVLRIIPRSINAVTKAKELETERIVLNAKLAESRISTMISQIRPHFIYNTLGSIEQLCVIDPPKAGELVHNFAKYLRGNFGELDNPKPILMSQEMEHVRHYLSIENVRFPDMTFSFKMNSDDFHIPALTIQPIVENAIKHGLMKLPKGGTINVISYENSTHYFISVEDDGVGFDTTALLDDRKHLGLRNIRERLKVMVNGSLEIESTLGVGTKVVIKIPKE